jgi:hypothetical protein
MILLLGLLHAPNQAQALLFDFLPADWVQLGSSEPVTLVLTGLALLSLARISVSAGRSAERSQSRTPVRSAAEPTLGAEAAPTSTRRAA